MATPRKEGLYVNTIVWNKLVKRLGQLAQKRVKVGVLEETGGNKLHPDSNLTLIELAAVHEFGSEKAGIPERSFIRSTAERSDVIRGYQTLAAEQVREVVAGKSANAALNEMGAYLAEKTKETIIEGRTSGPPLKQETIDRKGSSTPLLDTGALVDAIQHKIVDR
jgi:hypothetical protein